MSKSIATRQPAGERWSSQAGFLAAAIGSAVGLGNIWRFAYVAGQNGGGAFLVAYVIAVALCGLPLLAWELSAGRRYRGGVVAALSAIHPRLRLLGAGIALLGFVLLSYYLVITGWTLAYALYTLLGLDTTFDRFGASWGSPVFFLASTAVCFGIVALGVSRGIEQVCKVLIPILAVMVVGLAAYGLTLPGRDEAVQFFFQLRISELLSPKTWAFAIGQAFFSLGVGMGVMITYGSYQEGRRSLAIPAWAIAGADSTIAVMAGLAVFPMVFSLGFSPAAGPQLAFVTLPQVFDQMGAGVFIGTVFYLLLFIGAVTSAISLLEMAAVALAESTGWSHTRSRWTILLPLATLGTLVALSYSPVGLSFGGKPLLDTVDTAVGTFGLLAAGLMTCIALFWMGRPQDLVEEVAGGSVTWAERIGFLLGRFLLPPALVGTIIAYAATLL